ncbi:MAG: hypothetical protein LBR29_03525 [Methylobacteriaceae bacterium]|jgi:hypothetical protein|nr:hypothetical protein [Methylobacteriaceae bacterium]
MKTEMKFIVFLLTASALAFPASAQDGEMIAGGEKTQIEIPGGFGRLKNNRTLLFKDFIPPIRKEEWKIERGLDDVSVFGPYYRGRYVCIEPGCNPPGAITFWEQYDIDGDFGGRYTAFSGENQPDGSGGIVSVLDENDAFKLMKVDYPGEKEKLGLIVYVKKRPVKVLRAVYDYDGRMDVNEAAFNWHLMELRPALDKLL